MVPPPAAANPDFAKLVPVSVVDLAASDSTTLPEKFVKKEALRPTVAHNNYCKDVPVISLKGIIDESERARVVDEIGRACAEWGVFQIIDHGIPQDVLNRMTDSANSFFKRPLEEKLKYTSKPGGFPVGYASGSHRPDDDILDWRELMVHRTFPKSVREGDYYVWPEKPEDYRKVLAEYSDAVDRLVSVLLGAISESLGLPADYLRKKIGGEMAEQKVIFNYYPKCPQPELTLGLRCHTDYGAITILKQGEVGGLQAFKEDRDEWVTVEPIPGALVVNLGDQIQIISNGKYCSVQHQAVVNSNETRLSIAAFVNPVADAQMGPAPELLSETNPAKYRSYVFKDYLPISFARKTKNHYDAFVI